VKCLLFGGGGFLGLNAGQALAAQGHAVAIFDRPATVLRMREAHPGFEWIEGDFVNATEVAEAMRGREAVLHFVSTTLPKSSNDNPAYDLETNLVSTVRMLDAARDAGVRMVLFASSGGTVYGIPRQIPIPETHPTEPTCSYGIHKLAVEKYLALYRSLHGIDYRVLRISNPFGPLQRTDGRQGVVAVFMGRALRGEPIEIWGDGSVVRDFLHVSDVARAFVSAMEYAGAERVFNVGGGHGLSLNDLLALIESQVGRPVKRVYLPQRDFDVPSNVLDITRARSELGFEPRVPIARGLAQTLEWIRSSSQEP
jgi:UDP-glucose 4-epimerase